MSFKKSLQILSEKIQLWLHTILENLPNLILSIILILVFYFISTKINQKIKSLLSKHLKQKSFRYLIANIISILIVTLGIFLALSILNLDKALSSILAGAGVVGLAIGLALQSTLSNTFSGIFLSIKEIINIDDFIETNGYSGTVQQISLRYITLKEPDNNIVIIPNKLVVEKPFKNYGLTQRIRVMLTCGIDYKCDLDKVKRLAIDAIQEEFEISNEQDIDFFYTEFADSSINFEIRFWVRATSKLNQVQAKSNAITTLKKTFDTHHINIPYPTRIVDLR